MVDRAAAAAVECEALAANPAPDTATLCYVASCLEAVPLPHPLRGNPDDRVLAMAAAVRKGKATPEDLRAFAGELRDGAAVMVQTGWYRTLYGGACD